MSLAGKTVRAFFVIGEGVRFLWAMRGATPTYWKWRLGTVYGSFCRPSGKVPAPGELDVFAHRPLGDLWRDAVKDLEGMANYLLWRRDMRRKRHW